MSNKTRLCGIAKVMFSTCQFLAISANTVCMQFHGMMMVQSRHLNGFPDMPPVRPNFSYGDSLAGLHAAFGTVMALLHRQRKSPALESQHTSHGQVPQIHACQIHLPAVSVSEPLTIA